MNIKATATLLDGTKISGRLTTDHSASSYSQPVFVDADGQAYDWINIVHISTAAEIGQRGGMATSPRKAAASAENGRKGGRPRKVRND